MFPVPFVTGHPQAHRPICFGPVVSACTVVLFLRATAVPAGTAGSAY